jgi:Ca-activated chloride channel family protein
VALAVKEADKSPERRRILVLISDASQSSGNITTQSAAGLAANSGLPLYTVAVGAGTYDAEEIRTSGLIYHPANLELMKKLAESTGAQSYQAGDTASLEQAITDISSAEQYTAELAPQYYRQTLYQWPLLAALLILTLFQLIRLLQRQTT